MRVAGTAKRGGRWCLKCEDVARVEAAVAKGEKAVAPKYLVEELQRKYLPTLLRNW